MEINAGAGGTESMDWAAMLLRMYSSYSRGQGWKVEITDFVAGEEAGLKNVAIQVTGENAYGYLKAESGVHRLVRIQPLRRQRPPADLLRLGRRLPGGGRRHRDRHPGEGRAHGRLPRQAGQADRR